MHSIQDGRKPSSYQPLGWLNLQYLPASPIQHTRRSLDKDVIDHVSQEMRIVTSLARKTTEIHEKQSP